jgi:drug/metabolite transporter (DMT)-like permease
LARIILKEKYTLINLIATIFGLVGVVLVTKPEFLFLEISDRGESSLSWACATFGVSILAAVSYVCVRGAGNTVHPMKFVLHTAFVEFLSGFLINLVMRQYLVVPPCNWVRITLLLCGFGATAANLLIVRGLSLENSGPATLMRNGDIAFAYSCQVLFFRVTPDWISLLGATLIIGTAVLQGIDKLFDISRGISF